MTYPHAIVTSIEAPRARDFSAIFMASAMVVLGPGIEVEVFGIRVRRARPPEHPHISVAPPAHPDRNGGWRPVIRFSSPAWAALSAAVLAAAAAYPQSATLEPTT